MFITTTKDRLIVHGKLGTVLGYNRNLDASELNMLNVSMIITLIIGILACVSYVTLMMKI
ncbi:hypothetical protein [Xenorhabdus bovienii]|uniref:hypothetical protein n=1 Tax=Xenorhabdus bovienii TaxID=40576 RepID=UPI0023B2D8D4|nr:hypothetical protein [Xenorhabdus bovienii]